MRKGHFLPALSVSILLALIFASPPVIGQCTDRDQDGFYLESGCGSSLECNDDDGSSHPGAVEVCDGRDNDCDGLLDNAPACDRACTTPELVGVELSLTIDVTAHPSIAWSGTNYGVAHWTSIDANVLSLLSPYGQPLGTTEPFSRGGESPDESPAVVWTGSTYGVAEAPLAGWVHLTRLDVDGNVVTASTVTDADTRMTLDLVWTGSEFGA